MNFYINELPLPNETLDYLNVNIPFMTAEKNHLLLSKKIDKLYETAKKYRIYTDKDAISVNSDGIKDRFYFDYDAYTLNIEGNTVVKGSEYRKKTVDFASISSNSIVNMEELLFFMPEDGFLPKVHTYSRIIKKGEVEYSNFLSKSDIEPNLFNKEEGSIEVPNIYNLTVSGAPYSSEDNAIVSYGEATKFLLHKYAEVDSISVKSDNISNFNSEKMRVSNIEFRDNFEPEYLDELVNKKYMDKNVFLTDINSDVPIFIATSLEENSPSPINKEEILLIEDNYISVDANIARNIIIGDVREDIDDDHIVSNKEAEDIIKQFFYNIHDNNISNIAEFKEYLRSLCDIDESFVSGDFKIEGGKIYLGFDYRNMNSIFNSDAIKNILFKKTGAYDKESKEITYQSSRYFKEQEKISKLSAYAEQLGIEIDVSHQTLATTFDSIRKIVAKLCIMTPDVIPQVDVPDFPIVLPNVSRLISPVVGFRVKPLIIPKLVEPIYYNTKFTRPIVIVHPTYPTITIKTVEIPSLFHQRYYKATKNMRLIPPPMQYLSSLSGSTILPSIAFPKPKTIDVSCGIKKDGSPYTMVAFTSDGECRKRYISMSKRTLNMIDASALLSKMSTENMYGMTNDSIVIPVPYVVSFMLYETLLCASVGANIPLNVDFCSPVVTVEEDETVVVTGFCNSQESEATGGEEIELSPGKYFILNGLIIDESGNISGSPTITGVEWMNVPTIELTPFVPLTGSVNAENSKRASDKMISDLLAYIDPVRVGTILENGPSEAYVGGFNVIKNGVTVEDRVFMLDYINLEIKDGAPKEYISTASADPLGIFSGSDAEIVNIKDVGKEHIAVTTQGVSAGGPNGTILRVYDESISTDVYMKEVPYYVASGNENLFVPSDKLLMIEVPGEDSTSYIYDTSTGYSVTAGTKTIDNSAGEPTEYSGVYIDSPGGVTKFVRVTPSLGSLTGQSFPVPDCNAAPLPAIVTRTSPYVVIPTIVQLFGPSTVLECEETEEYYVQISRALEYNLTITVKHKDVSSSAEDFEDTEDKELIILAGETRSTSFTRTIVKDDYSEQSEIFEEYISKIVKSNSGGDSNDELIMQNKKISTAIIDNSSCSVNVAVTPVVVEGQDIKISITSYDNTRCRENPITYTIRVNEVTARKLSDYGGEFAETGESVDFVTGTLDADNPSLLLTIPTYEDNESEGAETLNVNVTIGECEDNNNSEGQDYEVLIVDTDFDVDEYFSGCRTYVRPPILTAGSTEEGIVFRTKKTESDLWFRVEAIDDDAILNEHYKFTTTNEREILVKIPAGETSASFEMDGLRSGTRGNRAFSLNLVPITSDNVEREEDCEVVETPVSSSVAEYITSMECYSTFIPPYAILENKETYGTIRISEARDSNACYTVSANDGTAVIGRDFEFVGSSSDEITLTIPAGETSVSFAVKGIANTISEPRTARFLVETKECGGECMFSNDGGGTPIPGGDGDSPIIPTPTIPSPGELPCSAMLIPPPVVESGKESVGRIVVPSVSSNESCYTVTAIDGSAKIGEDYKFKDTDLPSVVVSIPAGETEGEFTIIGVGSGDEVNSGSFKLVASVRCPNSCPIDETPKTSITMNFGSGTGGTPDIPEVPTPGTPILPQVPNIDNIVNIASIQRGCSDDVPAMGSGISGTVCENISDLSSIDPDTGEQDHGIVPGAITFGISLIAGDVEENAEIDGEIIPGTTMKTAMMTICGTLGAIDGNQNENGDVLAQGLSCDEIPEGNSKIYIGPSSNFLEITSYERRDDTSYFTISVADMLGDFKPEEKDTEIACSPLSLEKQASWDKVKIGNISMTGAMTHYKHAGSDPFWPVVSSFGGSEATSLSCGSHVISSGGGIMPVIIYTNEDGLGEYRDALPSHGHFFMFIGKTQVIFAVKDIPAGLSQNRTVTFQWG